MEVLLRYNLGQYILKGFQLSCNDLIDNSDIETIYESCRCVDQANVTSDCIDADTKVSRINLSKNGTILNRAPIERQYCRNAPLRSIDNSHGKIVINKLLVLKDAYRGKKITDKFHHKELEVYSRNQFVEIQLDAAWSGITHWPKLGFEFYKLDKYDHILYTLWSSFFSESFPLELEEKDKVLIKHTSYKTVPKKYKKGFGTWLLNNNIGKAFPMYKTIENERR